MMMLRRVSKVLLTLVFVEPEGWDFRIGRQMLTPCSTFDLLSVPELFVLALRSTFAGPDKQIHGIR